MPALSNSLMPMHHRIRTLACPKQEKSPTEAASLQDNLRGVVLEEVGEILEEESRVGTIDVAMVSGERNLHLLDLLGPPVLHHDSGKGTGDGQDGAGALGKEGTKRGDTKHAEVGDGEGAAVVLLGPQGTALCAPHEILPVSRIEDAGIRFVNAVNIMMSRAYGAVKIMESRVEDAGLGLMRANAMNIIGDARFSGNRIARFRV